MTKKQAAWIAIPTALLFLAGLVLAMTGGNVWAMLTGAGCYILGVVQAHQLR